ncbi:replication protein A 70 kDa DNA-binding subunit A-like [Senna tora]|uniref:Replication protein A 70 kDa DNA-binding subunit A-like n=1 Tax=Senna tora TaxID=362788 RepID=A0A834T3E9_9FABA|nr:replication protein A 70 kDa DNA-binding subunit A-like [Senna tora]
MMQHNFDSIRHINPFGQNWTIKARVLRLWHLPPYPKSSAHDSLEMVFGDCEGFKIGAHIKSAFALKFSNILKEGSVYIMSQFSFGSNSGGFCAVNHRYKLNFQFSTRVTGIEDNDNIHRYEFEFVTAQNILSVNLDIQVLVDVIGRVITMSPVHQSSEKDAKSKRLTIDIEDEQFKVELMVLDDSDKANVTVFDRDVSKFLGIYAPDLRKEHFQFSEKFDKFLGRSFVFKVSVRGSTWNTSPSYTVQRMTLESSIIEKFIAVQKTKVIQ